MKKLKRNENLNYGKLELMKSKISAAKANKNFNRKTKTKKNVMHMLFLI